MKEYKLRAEFNHDIDEFINLVKDEIVIDMRYTDEWINSYFAFKSKLSLAEIIKLLQTIQDGHVMCETIDYIEKFTGIRTWDNGEKLLKFEIRKDKIAKLLSEN